MLKQPRSGFSRILVTLALLFASAANANTNSLEDVYSRLVRPVVAGREAYLEYEVTSGKTPQLILRSRFKNSANASFVVGIYTIELGASEAKALKVVETNQNQTAVRQVHGRLQLESVKFEGEALSQAQGAIRSLLRADPLLHPQITPMVPGASAKASEPQTDVLKEMEGLRVLAERAGRPLRALVMMPTGHGKTFVSNEWAFLERRRSGTQPRVLFVLQANQVLKEAAEKFREHLSLVRGEEVFVQPDATNAASTSKALQDTKVKAWFLTRSAAYAHREEIANLYGRTDPVLLIFDEAHHLGRRAVHEAGDGAISEVERGQFHELLSGLEPHMRGRDQVVGLTATAWHKESDFLKTHFDGNLITVHLTAKEKTEYARTSDYMNMSRTSTMRAMAEGYLSPIYEYRQILYLGDKTLTAGFLNSARMARAMALSRDQQEIQLRREVTVHIPFLQTMLGDIRDRTQTLETEAVSPARGIIFVTSTKLADFYAEEISKLAAHDGVDVEFRAFHSDMPAERVEPTIAWFKQTTARHQHRYLFVVRSLSEGFDARDVNHLVLAKSYNADDAVAMRELLQNLGRGTRPAPYKIKTFVTDFSGRLYDLVFKNLNSLIFRGAVVRPYVPTYSPKPVLPIVAVNSHQPPTESFQARDVSTHEAFDPAVNTRLEGKKSASQTFRERLWLFASADDGESLLGVPKLTAVSMPDGGWRDRNAGEFTALAHARLRVSKFTDWLEKNKISSTATIADLARETGSSTGRGTGSVITLIVTNMVKSLGSQTAVSLLRLPLMAWPEVLIPEITAEETRRRAELAAEMRAVWNVRTLADFYVQIDHQKIFDRLVELERSPDPRHHALVRAFEQKPTLVRALVVTYLAAVKPKKDATPQQIKGHASAVETLMRELVRRVVLLGLPTVGTFDRSAIVKIDAKGEAQVMANQSQRLSKDLLPSLLGARLRPTSANYVSGVNTQYKEAVDLGKSARLLDLPLGSWSSLQDESSSSVFAGAGSRNELANLAILKTVFQIVSARDLYVFLQPDQMEKRVKAMLDAPTPQVLKLLTDMGASRGGLDFSSEPQALATAIALLSLQAEGERVSHHGTEWELKSRAATLFSFTTSLNGLLGLPLKPDVDRRALLVKLDEKLRTYKDASAESQVWSDKWRDLTNDVAAKMLTPDFLGYDPRAIVALQADAPSRASDLQISGLKKKSVGFGGLDALRVIKNPYLRNDSGYFPAAIADFNFPNLTKLGDLANPALHASAKGLLVYMQQKEGSLFAMLTSPIESSDILSMKGRAWYDAEFLAKLGIQTLADFWPHLATNQILADLARLEADSSVPAQAAVRHLTTLPYIGLADVVTILALYRLGELSTDSLQTIDQKTKLVQGLIDRLVFVRAPGVTEPLKSKSSVNVDDRRHRLRVLSAWYKERFGSEYLAERDRAKASLRRQVEVPRCEALFTPSSI